MNFKYKGKSRLKYSATAVTKSCGTSEWVLFHTIDLSNNNQNELGMINLKSDNGEWLKITVDDIIALEVKIDDLYTVFYKVDLLSSDPLFVDKTGSIYFARFSLEGWIGDVIKIYQKHSSQTANLTISGYTLSYLEGV